MQGIPSSSSVTEAFHPFGVDAVYRSIIGYPFLRTGRTQCSVPPDESKRGPARRGPGTEPRAMGRLSERAGKNRLAIIAGIAAAFALTWFVFEQKAPEVVAEEHATAKIVEIVHGGTTTGRGIAVVVAELPDGGRARIFTPPAIAVVGGDIRVTVRHYDDGSRRVSGADAEAP